MNNNKISISSINFNDNTVECKVDIESTNTKVIPSIRDENLNSKLKAIHLLIESIDLKIDCNEDFAVFEKVMLSILDQIGQAIKSESAIGDHRNLESVKYLIDDVFENNLFNSPKYQGIFDQEIDE